MTLALEEQRRRAEETLTLIAAANAVESDLNARLLAAILAQGRLSAQVTESQADQAAASALLADAEMALTAALLARDTFAARLESAEIQKADTATRLASVEVALDEALLARATLGALLQVAQEQQIATTSRLASADEALATALSLRKELRENLLNEASRRGDIETRLQAVEVALATITNERDALLVRIENSDIDSQSVSANLTRARQALTVALAEADALRADLGDEDQLRKLLASALAAKLAAEQQVTNQLSAAEQRAILLATAQAELAKEEALSADSLRKVALLNETIAAVNSRLASLQVLLDASDVRDEDSKVEITNLSARLNTALARVASEQSLRARMEEAERIRLEEEARQLARYRSEFFGEIRAVLGDREGVRIVGDRFVFSSEVLFDTASVVLADGGKEQIARVVLILNDISGAIPPEIDWVIRVDGHTDSTALSGTGRYRDNWELSQARALAVVRYMIDELGFPPTRLAATGFGEFRPIAPGDSPEALAQNRRIELKLTER
jgi:chemotaxis protein MotB